MIDIQNMTVLVVDDMKSLRLTIRKMLKNLDIAKTFKFAENGREALDSGDFKKALESFITVDKNTRGNIDAKFNIARLYYKEGKVIQADEYINQILRTDPKHEASLALRRHF